MTRAWPRWARAGMRAAAVMAVTAGVAGLPTAGSSAAGTPIAFGADVKPVNGQTREQAVQSFEAQIGGKHLAFTRDFLKWNSPDVGPYERWLLARGTKPVISVVSQRVDGSAVSWATVAAAQPGSQLHSEMVGWARRIRDLGGPVYFTYNHEPEAATSTTFGTPTEYVAAWRRLRQVFRDENVTNATWMFISTANGYKRKPGERQYVPAYYPGDADVDAIGVDAYNEFTCRYSTGSWQSLATRASGFKTFAAQHPSEPLWFAEWASVEDPALSGRKASWIRDVQQLFPAGDAVWSRVVGIAYFNQTRPGTSCDWHVDTSPSSLAAFRAMAADPFYAGLAP